MSSLRRRSFVKQTALLAGAWGLAAGVGYPRAFGAEQEIPIDKLDRLKSKLKGTLVLPSDDEYASAKRVFYWNPQIERTPVAIVRCAHEEDAVWAVEFARDHQLEVAVRSGGHSHLAWGSCDGVVIDVSPLKGVRVDEGERLLIGQGGLLGGEAAVAAGEYGLAPVFGQCPGVSATGVTLGGGLGWLSGLFGACCDNLLSARIVTADCQVVDVNADSDPELLWALSGAGANFGVATSFAVRLHAIGPVIGGDIHFATKDARAVLRGFSDVMRNAPDGFQATLNLTNSERGLFISLCHSGELEEADRLLEKIRSFAKPIREAVRQQPFASLAVKAAATTSGRAAAPAFRAVQTVYRDEITDEIIDIVADRVAEATPDVILGLSHYMHGQVCRVAPDATAFPHRKEHSIHLRAAFNWNDPSESARRFAWGEEWLKLLRPERNERIYANYQTYDTAEGAKSIFDTNFARVLSVKQRVDPENFFHRNANVTDKNRSETN